MRALGTDSNAQGPGAARLGLPPTVFSILGGGPCICAGAVGCSGSLRLEPGLCRSESELSLAAAWGSAAGTVRSLRGLLRPRLPLPSNATIANNSEQSLHGSVRNLLCHPSINKF